MTRSALTLLVVAALAAPASMLAQQAGLPSIPQSLSLRDAIDLATAYNPILRQTANDRAGAAWGVRNAYAAFLPSFSASGSLSYAGSGTQNFFGATSFQQPSSTVGSSYGLGLSMGLSGRTLMQPGLARAQLHATEAYITSAEVNLEALVQQRYLTVLEAEAQLEATRVQVVRNEEFLKLARARYEVGQNTMLDVRQAEVTLGQARVALLQAEQLVIVEKLRLFQQIGVPAPDDPTVVVLSDSFPIIEPQWELGDLLSDAQDRNPDLTALRAQESAARANERAVKSDWLPSLSLSAGWSGFTQQFTDPDPVIANSVLSAQQGALANIQNCQFQNDIIAGLATPTVSPIDCTQYEFTAADETLLRESLTAANDAWPFDFTSQPFSARVSVSLPIFTQFSRPLRVSQASAQADDARESVRARELEVRTAVSQAYYTLMAAHQAIEIQQQNQVAANEGLRLATERYRVGSGTFFELLDAQLAAQQADRDYINAIYAYHRAIATLEAAVGRPLR